LEDHYINNNNNIRNNINNKKIIVLNIEKKEFTLFDYNQEIDSIINEAIMNIKKEKSDYHAFFADLLFRSFFLILKDEDSIIHNRKINVELRSIEEKIIFNKMMKRNNEFLFFFTRYIETLIKEQMYYRLIDYFLFLGKYNKKEFFICMVKYFILLKF
jgi:hypothetical protein